MSDDRGAVRVTVFTGSVNRGEATVTADVTWSLGWPDAPGAAVDVTVVATDDAGNQTRVQGRLQFAVKGNRASGAGPGILPDPAPDAACSARTVQIKRRRQTARASARTRGGPPFGGPPFSVGLVNGGDGVEARRHGAILPGTDVQDWQVKAFHVHPEPDWAGQGQDQAPQAFTCEARVPRRAQERVLSLPRLEREPAPPPAAGHKAIRHHEHTGGY